MKCKHGCQSLYCLCAQSDRTMKTSEGVIILCALAAVIVMCEAARQKLNSINDLKRIDFGQSVPKHSLLLLHWFADRINMDHYNGITLSFNPNRDFGSHYYSNFEELLDQPRPRYSYYTVGNLNQDFPEYVRNPPVREYEGGNLDRIIISAETQPSGLYRINRVFLTQHIPGTTLYDPDRTYEISINLLQQIRQFASGTSSSLWGLREQFPSSITDYQLNAFRQKWGQNLVCLGLLLFIVIQDRYRPINNRVPQDPARDTQLDYLPNSSYRATQPVHMHTSSYNTGNYDNGEDCCWLLMAVIVIVVVILFFLTKK